MDKRLQKTENFGRIDALLKNVRRLGPGEFLILRIVACRQSLIDGKSMIAVKITSK